MREPDAKGMSPTIGDCHSEEITLEGDVDNPTGDSSHDWGEDETRRALVSAGGRWRRFIFMRGTYSFGGLDPVAVVALEQLQVHLMTLDHDGLLDTRGTQPDLLNIHARSATIWIFKHLQRLGHTFEPSLVERWALSNGWNNGNSQLLRDYATGVLAGARFHTLPDPFGLNASQWSARAAKVEVESTEE